MSASGELLPSKLKWVVLGCFAGLIAIMVAIYITSPKLLIDEASTLNATNSADPQAVATPSAKEHTISSPSDQLAAPHDEASVDSIIEDVEVPASPEQSNSSDSGENASASPPQGSASNSRKIQQCEFSLTEEKMIFGLVTKSVKAYYTPAYVDYKKEKAQQRKDATVIWFCTERQAVEAGYRNILQLQSLLR